MRRRRLRGKRSKSRASLPAAAGEPVPTSCPGIGRPARNTNVIPMTTASTQNGVSRLNALASAAPTTGPATKPPSSVPASRPRLRPTLFGSSRATIDRVAGARHPIARPDKARASGELPQLAREREGDEGDDAEGEATEEEHLGATSVGLAREHEQPDERCDERRSRDDAEPIGREVVRVLKVGEEREHDAVRGRQDEVAM